MKKVNTHINLDNYEAFYLDYLEGQLGRQEQSLLFEFLEQHPHLKMEDEQLPSLDEERAVLSDRFKSGLRVFDETEVITQENAEDFMVASVEHLLSNEKQQELEQFVQNHSGASRHMNLYQATKLRVDPSIHFPDKAQLKKTPVLPLFIRIAVAASIISIGVFLFFNKNASSSYEPQDFLAFEQLYHLEDPFSGSQSAKGVQQVVSQQVSVDHQNHGIESVPEQGVSSDVQVLPLKLKSLETIHAQEFSRNITALHLKSEQGVTQNSTAIPSAFVSFQEMENPIPLITKEVKKRLHPDVDFRHAKATREKQGGFYLKIGRFEISRKRSPEADDDLATN
ncbi:MAG: hypothetical protein EP338_01295 [Bacteroidetes bacterium]|nr:MAG: hypothetical protein EP338_01295 [Bacteroidota bacterium]